MAPADAREAAVMLPVVRMPAFFLLQAMRVQQ